MSGHFKLFDHHLIPILAATPELKYLNISGCPVNFDRYWKHVPKSLEELVLDEFSNRRIFISHDRFLIKTLLLKCPNLKIYLNLPRFECEDEQGCLRGLALMNGAQVSLDSTQFEINLSDCDDHLVAFERRVLESGRSACCMNIVF